MAPRLPFKCLKWKKDLPCTHLKEVTKAHITCSLECLGRGMYITEATTHRICYTRKLIHSCMWRSSWKPEYTIRNFGSAGCYINISCKTQTLMKNNFEQFF